MTDTAPSQVAQWRRYAEEQMTDTAQPSAIQDVFYSSWLSATMALILSTLPQITTDVVDQLAGDMHVCRMRRDAR
jgi:hypothetical protein